MKKQDKKILEFVNKIILRIRWRNTFKLGIYGQLIALVGAFTLQLISRFIPLVELPLMLLIMGGIISFIGLVVGFFYPVDKKAAILEADSHDMDERVITAYGLANDETPMGFLQKEDAIAHIEGFQFKKIGVKPERKLIIATAVLAVVMVGLVFLPNPMEERIKELSELNKAKKVAVKIIKQEEKNIEKNNKLSEKDKAKLKKELSEFRKVIKEAKNKTDMAKSTLQLEKKLQLMIKKDVTSALKAGESEKVKKLLDELTKALAKKDKEELKKLAAELAKAAEALKNDKKISDALAKLSKDIMDGKLSDAAGTASELGESLSQLASAGELKGALGQLAGQIRKASPLELAESGSSGQGQGQTSEGQTPGQGQGTGAGSAGSNGAGAGQGTGYNPGSGKGQGGSGVGNGSDPGSENQNPTSYGNGISHRPGPGTGTISDFDKVWTSKTLGGNSEKSNLSGKAGIGGTTAEAVTEKGISTAGKVVSYDKVIGEYTKEAVEGLSSKELLPALEKLVRDYFTGLN